jgi:flagella basal body P-ring formation protein FlgA
MDGFHRQWRLIAIICCMVCCAGAAWSGTEPDGSDSDDRSAGRDARGTSAETRSQGVPFVHELRVGEGGVLEAAAVAAALEAAIAARLPQTHYEVEMRAPATMRVGSDPVELVIEVPPAAERGGSAVIHLRVMRGPVLVRESHVPITVRRWLTVAVVSERLSRGALLTPAQVVLERHLLAGRDQPYESLAAVIGMRARRSLSVGRVLCAGDLESPPLVNRGETVQVTMTQGAIEIEFRAEALSDGWLGDRVRVRNPITRTVMIAEVAGGGRLRLAQ